MNYCAEAVSQVANRKQGKRTDPNAKESQNNLDANILYILLYVRCILPDYLLSHCTKEY